MGDNLILLARVQENVPSLSLDHSSLVFTNSVWSSIAPFPKGKLGFQMIQLLIDTSGIFQGCCLLTEEYSAISLTDILFLLKI